MTMGMGTGPGGTYTFEDQERDRMAGLGMNVPGWQPPNTTVSAGARTDPAVFRQLINDFYAQRAQQLGVPSGVPFTGGAAPAAGGNALLTNPIATPTTGGLTPNEGMTPAGTAQPYPVGTPGNNPAARGGQPPMMYGAAAPAPVGALAAAPGAGGNFDMAALLQMLQNALAGGGSTKPMPMPGVGPAVPMPVEMPMGGAASPMAFSPQIMEAALGRMFS